jgi:hypothetical protein
MPHALSDIKSLHVTYYGWHDLPQGLWIINEYFNYFYNVLVFTVSLNEMGTDSFFYLILYYVILVHKTILMRCIINSYPNVIIYTYVTESTVFNIT